MTIITTAKEICSAIEEICDHAEKFRNSYFWASPCNAKSRRDYEEFWSIPEFSFEYSGKTYTAEYRVECSCKNIYAKGIYTRDGAKTTLTALKNVLKKLQAET